MNGTNIFRLLGTIAIDGVDEASRDLNDLSDDGQRTSRNISKSFQDMGTKAGELGKKFAVGLGALATALTVGIESSREFRQDWGKLTTTFKEVEGGTKTATNVFKDFYGLLGEDDTSIEAANHLAMMTKDQKALSEWTNIATGVYATFGDSLPLEGLTEAANETMRVGQVTGPLADALNWAGVSEDEFNAKLEKTNSNAEREALIRETLNGLYGDSADTFKKTNKTIIDANKAQADMSLQLNETMNKLEPLLTEVKLFLAEMLQKAQPFITWMIDNINILAPIILGFLGALFALNIASKIMAIIPLLTALNAVMAANPIGLIIIAVAALIAIFITLWKNCEGFRNFWKGLWEGIKKVFGVFIDAIKAYIDFIINYFKFMWEVIKKVFDIIVTGIKKYIEFIIGIYKGLFNAIKVVLKGISDGAKATLDFIKNIWQSVSGWFNNTIIKPISNFFSNMWSNLKNGASNAWNGIKSVFSKVADFFGSIFSKAWSKVKSIFSTGGKVFSGITEGIKSAFTKVVNAIIRGINKVVSLPFGFINGTLNKIRTISFLGISPFKNLWGQNPISVPKIPELYEGAVLEKGQTGYLEGNGAEAVVPLHNNKKWISAVANDMQGAVGNTNNLESKLDRVIDLLTSYFPQLSGQQVVLSTGEVVGALVNPMDKALGELANKKGRGY